MPLYYNLFQVNETDDVKPCILSSNIETPFLLNPSDYKVSIIRFSIPNYNTKLLEFPQPPIYYKITMTYQTFSYTADVAFIIQNDNYTEQYIYEIQALIQMINAGFAEAWNGLNALVTLPTTELPYIYYTETTQLISYVANKNYYATDGTLSYPINVSINIPLLTVLQGLQIHGLATSPLTYQILLYDTHNNNLPDSDHYTMTQQAPTFGTYCDFANVFFTTTLPIKSEYSGSNTANPIIQDFQPNELKISDFRNSINYSAVGAPYRQVDLLSNIPVRNIMFYAYYTDSKGKTQQIYVQPNAAASMKLMFTLKSECKY